MPHIYTSFQSKEVNKLVRAVDFTGIVFDAMDSGKIDRDIAAKAIMEVMLAADVAEAARLWSCIIVENDTPELASFSFLDLADEAADEGAEATEERADQPRSSVSDAQPSPTRARRLRPRRNTRGAA